MSSDLLLQNIRKHVDITEQEIGYIASSFQTAIVEKNVYLLKEGIICKYQSFIIEGCFTVFYIDNDGVEQVSELLIEEWWAMDLLSFHTLTPAKVNIKAKEHSKLLQINKENLELLLQNVPKLERFFRILFQNAFIAQSEKTNVLQSLTAQEKYSHFIAKKPYAEQRFSQKEIASYLGMTRQFLCALKKKLR